MVYDMEYSEFDINEHNKKYKYYCEVVILSNGKIEYAVPSHQEKCMQVAIKETGKSRALIESECPLEMYADYLTYLENISGCVCVWYDFYIGKPNRFQKVALRRLIENRCVNFKKELCDKLN